MSKVEKSVRVDFPTCAGIVQLDENDSSVSMCSGGPEAEVSELCTMILHYFYSRNRFHRQDQFNLNLRFWEIYKESF